MYRVVHFFTDLQDGNHPYYEGNCFPREGVSVDEMRLAELSGSQNLQHKPLIQEVAEVPSQEEVEVPKKTGAKRTAKKASA